MGQNLTLVSLTAKFSVGKWSSRVKVLNDIQLASVWLLSHPTWAHLLIWLWYFLLITGELINPGSGLFPYSNSLHITYLEALFQGPSPIPGLMIPGSGIELAKVTHVDSRKPGILHISPPWTRQVSAYQCSVLRAGSGMVCSTDSSGARRNTPVCKV